MQRAFASSQSSIGMKTWKHIIKQRIPGKSYQTIFILIKANRTRSQGMEDIYLSTCWQNQSSQVSREQLAPTPSQSQLTTDKLVVKNKSRQHKDLLTFEYLIILTLYNKCIFENHLSGGACELAVFFPNDLENFFCFPLSLRQVLRRLFSLMHFLTFIPTIFTPGKKHVLCLPPMVVFFWNLVHMFSEYFNHYCHGNDQNKP